MLKLALGLALFGFLSSFSAKADIDDMLKQVQKQNSQKEREESLFREATVVGKIMPMTQWNLSHSIGGSETDEQLQKLVWATLDIGNADRNRDGQRRRAVAIVIKNNPIHIAEDGPTIKLEQFWMRSKGKLNDTAEATRIESLENKSVSLDSVPYKNRFSSMFSDLKKNLNTIADFYGTYQMQVMETRVYFLPERQYIDSFQVKAITNDNTPNFLGELDVRVVFE